MSPVSRFAHYHDHLNTHCYYYHHPGTTSTTTTTWHHHHYHHHINLAVTILADNSIVGIWRKCENTVGTKCESECCTFPHLVTASDWRDPASCVFNARTLCFAHPCCVLHTHAAFYLFEVHSLEATKDLP